MLGASFKHAVYTDNNRLGNLGVPVPNLSQVVGRQVYITRHAGHHEEKLIIYTGFVVGLLKDTDL